MEYFELAISCIFINNILLAQFLGNCPFLGTSKKWKPRSACPWPWSSLWSWPE